MACAIGSRGRLTTVEVAGNNKTIIRWTQPHAYSLSRIFFDAIKDLMLQTLSTLGIVPCDHRYVESKYSPLS